MLWIFFAGLFLWVYPYAEAGCFNITELKEDSMVITEMECCDPILKNASLEHSGLYICSLSQSIADTVWSIHENFSAIWVEASHGAHIFEEGQNVTLKCEASSTPASVAWSWERLDKKRVWQEVDTEKQLVLSRMEDSGEYRCRGHSEILNVTRKSPAYQVYFFSIPNSGSVSLAAAALSLSLLALLLLVALGLWLWLKERPSPNTRTAEPNDYGSKGANIPPVDDDGDVYMNSVEIEKVYSNLNPTFRAEDQSFATLT
ncbi:uncharacterized protein LOC116223519 [Clupea harengus]|uniref:Uncharacterized protein LOC116223519 n=1 Tax=Clupea harengus TaxID=7950 RepID=A0A6P8GGL5_CLUHA|nr:uncharacterized protein LOC116223519 [Clupea harengus]